MRCQRLATQEALFHYQKTILEALEETENAIAAFRSEEERHHHFKSAYQSYQKALESTKELYQRGGNDFFEMSAAAKSLLSAEEIFLQSQVELLLNYVSLYKALGGSWVLECE